MSKRIRQAGWWRALVQAGRFLTARRLLWSAAFFVLAFLMLGSTVLSPLVRLEVGQPSPGKFTARRSVQYTSDVLTEAARQEAASQVQPVYRVDGNVLRSLQNGLTVAFQNIRQIRESGEPATAAAEKLFRLGVGPAGAAAALESTPEDWRNLETRTAALLEEIMGAGVPEQGVEKARSDLLAGVDKLDLSTGLRAVARDLLASQAIQANLVYDALATERNMRQAREAVQPVMVSIKQNEVILNANDPVSAAKIESMQKLGMLTGENSLRGTTSYIPLLGAAMLVLLLEVLVLFYLYQFRREIYERERLYTLLGLVMLVTLLLARAMSFVSLSSQPELAALSGFLPPVAAGSMLLAILLDKRLAIFITVPLAVMVGLMAGPQVQYTVVALLSGLVGVYSVSRLTQRYDMARSSLYVAGANAAGMLAFGFFNSSPWPVLVLGLLVALLNGILSTVLTIGTLPFLESAFGITTAVRLLELSNPNQPLLKRLLLEAPGTYHHSLMVGNLAESAADAVGADSLLARVGAYFHDVGKLKRPYFFIENQFTTENPHDKLAPSLSTLIITAHVKDGLEMAREHHLPPVLLDIIAQHHGGSLLSFFYHKAAATDHCESVSEEDYRYDTPKPVSREAAIVMLADSVEAGVRSMQKPTPGRLEGFVHKVIKEKLEDGQLQNCDLTFRELNTIAQSFLHILNGIFHSRIEYPDLVVRELERRKAKDAHLRAKPTG